MFVPQISVLDHHKLPYLFVCGAYKFIELFFSYIISVRRICLSGQTEINFKQKMTIALTEFFLSNLGRSGQSGVLMDLCA